MIKFSLPIMAIAKQGDRSRIVKMKTGKQFVHHYQTKEIKDHEKNISAMCAEYRPIAPLEGPLELKLTFRWPFNKSVSRKKRSLGSSFKDTKPDLDNLMKQVADCLQKTGFFVNDSQIASARISKIWCDQGGIDVEIARIGGIS